MERRGRLFQSYLNIFPQVTAVPGADPGKGRETKISNHSGKKKSPNLYSFGVTEREKEKKESRTSPV